MIGPLGRLGAAATLRQHCPQMTQRPGIALAAQSGARNLMAPHATPCQCYPPPFQPALPCLVADLIHCLSPGGGAPSALFVVSAMRTATGAMKQSTNEREAMVGAYFG